MYRKSRLYLALLGLLAIRNTQLVPNFVSKNYIIFITTKKFNPTVKLILIIIVVNILLTEKEFQIGHRQTHVYNTKIQIIQKQKNCS